MKSAFLVCAAALSLSPLSALAHATLDVAEAKSGAYQRIAVRIPHGCDGAPTIAVEVEIPEGVISTKPMPKPGWALETVKGPYARSYENHGREVAEGVRMIRWSGGELPNDYYDEFILRGKIAAAGGAALPFKVRQTCPEGGEVYWSEIPAEGQDRHDLKRPAPVLRVAQAGGGHGHGHDHAHGQDMKAGQADMPTGAASQGPISIEGAYAFANPSGGGASAAFMTVSTSGAADRIVSATSPVGARIELHTHEMDDKGVMRMHQVPFIPLGPDAPAQLRPGGFHVMLMGLHAPLEPGQKIDVTLTLEQAGEITVTTPVRARAAMRHDMKQGDHDHGGHKHGAHDMKQGG